MPINTLALPLFDKDVQHRPPVHLARTSRGFGLVFAHLSTGEDITKQRMVAKDLVAILGRRSIAGN